MPLKIATMKKVGTGKRRSNPGPDDFATEHVSGSVYLMRRYGDRFPMRKTPQGGLAFLNEPGDKHDGTKASAMRIARERLRKRRKGENPKRARAKSRVFAVEVAPSRTDRGYRLTIRAMTARTAKEEARRYCAKQQGAPLSQFKLPRVKVTAIGEMAGSKRSGNPSVPVQEVPRRRLVAELRKLGFTGVRGMSDAKLRLVLMQLGHLTVKRKR